MKVFLMFLGIVPVREKNLSFKCECPHCHQMAWYYMPALRLICPSCKEEFGFKDDMVYKITDKNKHFFQSEQEKTNGLLKELKDKDKSNLEQLKELKELLDMDAITQEEYDRKKKELLK